MKRPGRPVAVAVAVYLALAGHGAALAQEPSLGLSEPDHETANGVLSNVDAEPFGGTLAESPLSLPLIAPAQPRALKPSARVPAETYALVSELPSDELPPVYLSPLDAAMAVPLESLGLVALVTYTGFSDWKWGTASFRFNSEGWFSMDTGSGGMDKAGHAYGAYMSSELLYWRLRASQDNRRVVTAYPAIFGTLLYLYIEMFDGYSVDHGFAYEDVIMNTSGVVLSVLRNTFPIVQSAFDYRLEYIPSRGFDFHPVIDYEGQKFLGAFKLAAFPSLSSSPLRFVELLLGYYTRGFDKDLSPRFRQANVFFGVGVSLEQLLFKPLEAKYGWPFDFMGLASNYFQLPGTYMYQERTRTRLNR